MSLISNDFTAYQFFQSQENDAYSDYFTWNSKIANILVEGTWDSANIQMQIRYTNSGEWVHFMTFTEDGFAIVDNLIPGWQVRFSVASSGLSTSLTCTMMKS